MATLQACSLDVRPTAGAPRVLVKLRRGRRGKIALPTSEQLHPDRTIALHHMGKEWAVIQQAIAGNSDAQEHLFTRQTSRLYRTAFALLCNKEDAEDAVQESLCKAYTRLRSFEGRSSFSTWLTRIVINSALMARRRRKSVHPETSLDEILGSQPERLPHGLIDCAARPRKALRRDGDRRTDRRADPSTPAAADQSGATQACTRPATNPGDSPAHASA